MNSIILLITIAALIFAGCIISEKTPEPEVHVKESPENFTCWDVIIYANLSSEVRTTYPAATYSPLELANATSLPASYTLVFNLTYDKKTKKSPLKVYKKYHNGTLVELHFPSDTFENFRRNHPHRRQLEELGLWYYIFNSTPDVIAWDGRYCLMDNGYSIIKYDGEKFRVYRLVEHPYTPHRPYQIIPLGDDCWIITYVSAGDPFNGIMVFDGEKIVKKMVFRDDSNTTIKIRRLNDCNLHIIRENGA